MLSTIRTLHPRCKTFSAAALLTGSFLESPPNSHGEQCPTRSFSHCQGCQTSKRGLGQGLPTKEGSTHRDYRGKESGDGGSSRCLHPHLSYKDGAWLPCQAR
eukprot:s1053_g14.t1